MKVCALQLKRRKRRARSHPCSIRFSHSGAFQFGYGVHFYKPKKGFYYQDFRGRNMKYLIAIKHKIHYPFKWIQLMEWSNYLNMNSCLHLSNKLKGGSKFLWICFWDLLRSWRSLFLVQLQATRQQPH